MAQQQPQWMVAQDTFSGDLPDGSGFTVLKGQHLLSTHEVVKLDQGRGVLFKPLELAPGEEPVIKPAPSAAKGARKAAS